MRSRSRIVSLLTLILLTSPPSLSAAVAAPATSGTAARAAGVSTIRIDNFGRVDDAYYRGAQPEGRDYADLAALGIKTVIDLQADGDNPDEARLVKDAGMTFYRIPMTTHVPPTPAQLVQFLAIVTDPARQPVYVHCKGGKHRTGVMSAVYRIERGWAADRAFQEMKRYRFGADFLHSEFKRFVLAYVPGRLAAAAAPVATAASSR